MTATLPPLLGSAPLHVIGGRGLTEGGGGIGSHVNPTYGRETKLQYAGPEQVDEAISAARAALPVWNEMAPTERRDAMLRLAQLIKDHEREISDLAIWENGLLRSVAPFLAVGTAGWFEYYAGYVDKYVGDVVRHQPFTYTINEPYGVIAALTPFNGPVFEIGMKIAPALAAGNTVVLKAPELAPFSAGAVAALALEAGIPPGVFNVVVGDPSLAAYLVAQPTIDKISFTGSNTTAQSIMAAAAKNTTPLILELGGKSACLVLEDGDVDAAALTVASMAMSINAGQVCSAPTRVIAHRSVYEQTVSALADAANSLKIGDPGDVETALGPVITARSADRIVGMIDRAVREGAGRVVTGGARARLGGDLAEGSFVSATVVGDVDPRSSIARDEIFGPVVSVIPVDTDEEAVKVANDSRYGLAAYLFTRDVSKAHLLARRLEAGQVSVNGNGDIMIYGEFGGKKGSGFGREGGRGGLDEFVSRKTVACDL